MAQFATHKRTLSGRSQTLTRRAVRRVKYDERPLDVETLTRQLVGGAR